MISLTPMNDPPRGPRAWETALASPFAQRAMALAIFSLCFLALWARLGGALAPDEERDPPHVARRAPYTAVYEGAWRAVSPAEDEETAPRPAAPEDDQERDSEAPAESDVTKGPAAAPVTREHIVAKGESLWKLAERFLGDGHRWPELASLNPGLKLGRNAARLKPGMRIRIAAGTSANITNSTKVKDSDKSDVARQARRHIVARGEDLYTIARRYRPGKNWRWLFNANKDRIRNPNRIAEGVVLVVPAG